MDKLRILSGNTSAPLTTMVCERLSLEPTACTVGRFNDGEVRVQIGESVRGDDVFVVNATNPPFENALELVLLAKAARYASAQRVTLVIPYLGYNRQDRKDQPRVPVTAKLVIDMLKLTEADRVLLVDLHSEATAAYFEPLVSDHLYASYRSVEYLKRMGNCLGDSLVVAAPDAGAGARARKYAQYLGLADVVFFNKHRTEAGNVDGSSIKIIGDVRDRDVLFIDDMIDTGGTLIADAEAAKAAGARRVFASATHGLFSKGRSVFPSGLFEEIVVTDTIAQPQGDPGSGTRITVIPIAPLLASAIRRIHHEESLTGLILE
jgi:ribose-phosphate pyrophosphokinase